MPGMTPLEEIRDQLLRERGQLAREFDVRRLES